MMDVLYKVMSESNPKIIDFEFFFFFLKIYQGQCYIVFMDASWLKKRGPKQKLGANANLDGSTH